MESFITQRKGENSITIKAQNDSGEFVSTGDFRVEKVRFCSRYVDMLLCCGIETKPYARRKGLVGRMLSMGEAFGRSRGAVFSVLHPFSFSFYRKYGYERVSDTLIISFPIRALDFVPYCNDLRPLTAEMVPRFREYYDSFNEKRNLMFGLPEDYKAPGNMYVLTDGGEIRGHVLVDNPKTFDGVNKMNGDGLTVREMGFADPRSLGRILGFLRMFESEQPRVIIKDAGPLPEVDTYLKHYMDTSYVLRPDIMAKVLDSEKALRLVRYRKASGNLNALGNLNVSGNLNASGNLNVSGNLNASGTPDASGAKCDSGTFTVRINSAEPEVGGTFQIIPDADSPAVTRLCKADEAHGADGTANHDIEVSAQALSRLVFGCDSYTAETAAYLPGVVLSETSQKVLDAFPKQINGNFYHF